MKNFNAWIDTTQWEKGKLKRIRNWMNEKIHTIHFPVNNKLNQDFIKDYELILVRAINNVLGLKFKDLKEETVYY